MGNPTKKDIQAYVDALREKVPDLKGQSYGTTAKYAATLYDPELDVRLPSASPEDRSAIERMRTLIPKPNYTLQDFARVADAGSTGWTLAKGFLEGLDPIGNLYKPLYDPEDEDSWSRSGASLTGALATGLIPVAGPAAKLLAAAKLAKTTQGARIVAGLAKGEHHGVNAFQAQSGLRSTNNQLGLDTPLHEALGMGILGVGASKLGTMGSGKAGIIGAAQRVAPVVAMTDMQMGTHPMISRSEELKDVLPPLRYPALIAKGLENAKTPQEKWEVIKGTLGLPLIMGAASGAFKGKPFEVNVPKSGGGVWDLSPTADLPAVERPAAVAPPAAATAARGESIASSGPTASGDPFFYPMDKVKEVVDADINYALGRGLDKLRDETYSDMPLKVNVIQPDGTRGAMVGSFGRERVSMLFPAKPALSVSRQSVLGLPKEINFSLGGNKEVRIAMDANFMPGFQAGRYQVRTFKGDDGNIRVVVAHNPTTKEFLVFNPLTGETRVGPREAWPNMPRPFERRIDLTREEKIAQGKGLDQKAREQQSAPPYPRPLTSRDAVLEKFNAMRTKFGI